MTTNRNHLDFNRRPLTQPKRGERVKKFAQWGAGLALAGLTFGSMNAIASKTHGYSDEELQNMPKVTYTVGTGEGAISIVRDHEPTVLDNQSNAASIENFITSQGTAKDQQGNPVLGAGQEVQVPVPDGVTFAAEPPK